MLKSLVQPKHELIDGQLEFDIMESRAKINHLRSILIQTSEGLTTDDLQKLVFLSSDVIGSETDKENIKIGLDLFEILLKRDVLGESSIDYLLDLLLEIKRIDLWKKLANQWGKPCTL